MRYPRPLLLFLALALAACHKDDVDIAALTDNPFDPDYDGSAVFVAGDTYVANPGDTLLVYQAFEFTVREDLFLAPATYQVRVADPDGTVEFLSPNPPGSNAFRYLRPGPEPGREICLELRLSNNRNHARAETMCATLP